MHDDYKVNSRCFPAFSDLCNLTRYNSVIKLITIGGGGRGGGGGQPHFTSFGQSKKTKLG